MVLFRYSKANLPGRKLADAVQRHIPWMTLEVSLAWFTKAEKPPEQTERYYGYYCIETSIAGEVQREVQSI